MTKIKQTITKKEQQAKLDSATRKIQQLTVKLQIMTDLYTAKEKHLTHINSRIASFNEMIDQLEIDLLSALTRNPQSVYALLEGILKGLTLWKQENR